MDTRRLLLAFLLSLAVMILWGKLFPPAPPRSVPEEQEAVSPAPATRPAERGEQRVAVEPAVEAAARQPAAVPGEPVTAAREEPFVVESESFRAEFSNRGAQLVSFELLEHVNSAGGPVDLVRQRAAAPYPFGLTGPNGESSPLNEVLFVGERQTGARGLKILSFRYRGPAGWAEKRFSFPGNGLFEVDVVVPGRSDWGLALGPGIRNPSAKELKSRFARRSAVYLAGGEIERFDPTDEERAEPGYGLSWVGIQDTYFLTALVPSSEVERVLLKPMVAIPAPDGGPAQLAEVPAGGEAKDLVRDVLVVVAPKGDRISGVSYWGPKEYEHLASYSYGLEGTIELGWFSFFSLWLLRGIRWIHEHMVHNYGWAIILMTVLIRVVLFPLTHKSTVSMQKMQQLNPKIQAIRQKYRAKLKDKKGRPNPEAQRKMNEEVMALYKSEGVSPAGGCFPMLLQLPVLFAFYSLLSAAIELRHAPWMLWIHDLSAPDPYYVLPIIMGASQFVQQRMTPPAADPMQRRLFQMMPIFFTVLFLGFPSGLVLYWLTNNVLGIAQQAAYKRARELKEAPKKGSSDRKTKRGASR